MSSFECTNSVFNTTIENNSFSISIPGRWRTPNYLEGNILDEQKKLPKLKSENDTELHVQEDRKQGKKIKTKSKENSLSDFDSSKETNVEELKSAKYHDLEDLVNRMQLTYEEIIDILDRKYNPTKRTRYTLPRGKYEVTDIDLMLKSVLPNDVKTSITIDEIRLKSNLKKIKL